VGSRLSVIALFCWSPSFRFCWIVLGSPVGRALARAGGPRNPAGSRRWPSGSSCSGRGGRHQPQPQTLRTRRSSSACWRSLALHPPPPPASERFHASPPTHDGGGRILLTDLSGPSQSRLRHCFGTSDADAFNGVSHSQLPAESVRRGVLSAPSFRSTRPPRAGRTGVGEWPLPSSRCSGSCSGARVQGAPHAVAHRDHRALASRARQDDHSAHAFCSRRLLVCGLNTWAFSAAIDDSSGYAAPCQWNVAIIGGLVTFGGRGCTGWRDRRRAPSWEPAPVAVRLPTVAGLLHASARLTRGSAQAALVLRNRARLRGRRGAIAPTLTPSSRPPPPGAPCGAVVRAGDPAPRQPVRHVEISAAGSRVAVRSAPSPAGRAAPGPPPRGLRRVAFWSSPGRASHLGDVVARALYQSGAFTRNDGAYGHLAARPSASGVTMGRLYSSAFYACKTRLTPSGSRFSACAHDRPRLRVRPLPRGWGIDPRWGRRIPPRRASPEDPVPAAQACPERKDRRDGTGRGSWRNSGAGWQCRSPGR
jgi:hypothetical protein